MRKCGGPVLLVVALLCIRPGTGNALQPARSWTSEAEFFTNQILPIFAARCQSCHNRALKLSGLSLESAAALETGGTLGPVVVPGNPLQSRLYRRVARIEQPFMPMEGEVLSESEVKLIKSWIERGAVWPKEGRSNKASVTQAVESGPEEQEPWSANARLFKEMVQPILSARCGNCHNDERKYSGFTLETRSGFFSGGWHGPVVLVGKPEQSRLYRRIAHLEKTYMPFGQGEPLPASEIDLIKEWIEGGAEWPEDAQTREEEQARHARLKDMEKLENRPVTGEEREWWSFVKPVRPAVPAVKHTARVKNPIDAFILAALEAKGLQPAPMASRQMLIRRVYLDVIGLPPSPEEVQAFQSDPSPDAYQKVVDRLLDSERYGERWGRHWLDVVRYADSDGYEYDRLRPNAWRYRDYVIRSFNHDKPYSQFILEQLAGDELPQPSYDSLTALGFCRSGPFIGDMVLMQNEMTRQDELDDVVSTTSAAFLGLTMGCARCHNHKYDPLSQKDYYRMVAVFAPSVRTEMPLVPDHVAERYDREVFKIDRQVDKLTQELYRLQKPVRDRLLEAKYKELPEPIQIAIRTDPAKRTEAQKRQAIQVMGSVRVKEDELMAALSVEDRKKAEELKKQIEDLEKSKPSPLPSAMAITDPTTTPANSYFLHRGSTMSKGSAMEPGPPLVLSASDREIVFPKPGPQAKTTGRRLALAKWLASEENPLTTRVMVNRIWQHHFGKGIVETPNDFGRMGAEPTNQQLLDWLATEFVRQGWSVKAMHRLILMSNTYQQASNFTHSANENKDPQNKLLWKMPMQRLEGEIIRDSILAVSGGLNLKAGGPGVFPELDPGLIGLIEATQNKDQQWPVTQDGPALWRRSVYVTQKRSVTAPIMDLFDPPDLVSSCPTRNTTTVAPQALQLLNNKFVIGQSTLFAERLRNEMGKDRAQEIDRAFWLSYGRPPDAVELGASIEFLKIQEAYHSAQVAKLEERGVDPANIPAPDKAALIDFCHSLFNSNEFIYVN
ncbi:MAG: PSD1 and planctomycete cytochrome C domain-containing protein [Acidobacteriota bacterium]